MKKSFSILLGLILLICCGLTACGGKKPREYSDYYHGIDFDTEIGVVAQNGQSEYSIVLPSDANESEHYAALELQNFLVQSTNTSVRITTDEEVTWSEGAKFISLGKNKLLEASGIEFEYSTLNLDGFFLKTVGSSLFIDADVDRGLLYGVYDYLEKFVGVRFIADDETYVPELDRLAMYKMDVVEIPDFAMRSYLYGDIYSVYADADYYVRSRTNDSFTSMDEKHGGRSSIWGRNSQHNFHFYCDPEGMEGQYGAAEGQTLYEKYGDKWFYKHPQYGWTVNLTNGITADGKLDTSMENSVVKTIIEEMKKDIVANPDIVYFNLDQEDGPFFYPYTDPADLEIEKKYGRSGILIRFMNVVLEELQKWSDETQNGREINIVTFAYSYTVTAPVKKQGKKTKPIDDTVIADDNLYIRLCIYENPVYTYEDPKQDQTTIKNMTDWKLCASNFFLWGYDMDFANYLWYYPNRGRYSDNLRYVKDMGYTYAMFQGTQNSKTAWYGGMNSYVVSKLMWDIDRNPEELYEEYIHHYYGSVAEPYLNQFFNTFDQHYASLLADGNEIIVLNGGGNHTSAEFWDLSLLQLGCTILENAEAAVQESTEYTAVEKEKYIRRIANVRATPMYMILKNYATYYPYGGTAGRLNFLKQFIEVAELGAVDRVSEGQTLESFKTQSGL